MPSTNLDNQNSDVSFCVIVPTYNNENTLREVLNKVLKQCDSVLVVNDGSTDSTSQILSEFKNIELIAYSENVGKGNALKLGLRKAFEMGFDYAVTIDSDGQHYPTDIPKVVDGFRNNPGHLIMGSRNMEQEGIPNKSSFGNKFSNFWFWVETGITLSDTQTGFRAYPLKPLENLKFFTKKFEFEIEIIVRLAWRNVKFSEVKVNVDYPEDRVSHFRPLKDFTRIGLLNTVLVTFALLFFLPRLAIYNFSISGIIRKLKEEFAKDINHPSRLASAVGLGLFFGILPIWGIQMLAAFAVASYFKLNRAIVLLVSNISIPPMIPIIIYVSFKFGSLFVEEPVYLVALNEIDSETIYLQVRQYVIGSTIMSVVAGVLGFVTTRITMGLTSK